MPTAQTEYSERRDAVRPIKASIVGLVDQIDGTSALELRVNIEGRDLPILLSIDALANHGLSDQAVADQLQTIREEIEKLRSPVGRLAGAIDKLAAAVAPSKDQ